MKKQVVAIALAAVVTAGGFPPTALAQTTVSAQIEGTVTGNEGEEIPVEVLRTPQEAAQEISDEAATQTEVVEPELTQPDAFGIQLYALPDVVETKETLNRLIVRTGQNLSDSYGAGRAYYYTAGSEYILEYESYLVMQEAYQKLAEEYGDDQVFQDEYITCPESTKGNVIVSEAEEEQSSTGISWGLQTMGLDTLRDAVNKENQSLGPDSKWNHPVTVAVIDTGIDKDHPALKARISKESISLADDTKQSDYDDREGHGTHVSGIVLQGTSDNVDVLGIRIFDAEGRSTVLKISLAIDYVVDVQQDTPRAEVINMSLGEIRALNSQKSLLDASMERAVKKGVVILAAAGNENRDTADTLPVNSRWTIGAGAITKEEKVTAAGRQVNYVWARWQGGQASNYGDYVDFTAPGTDIDSTWNDGGYASESGTSMACPHLAAAAAMIKVRHPDYDQGDIYAAFLDYAVDLGDTGWDRYFGNGYVDLSDYFSDQESSAQKKLHQGISLDRVVYKTTADIGKSFSLEAALKHGDGTLSYRLADGSQDGKVAQVQGDQIRIIGAGSCEIVVTASETEKYAQTSQNVQIFVEKMPQTVTASTKNYTKKSTDGSFKVSAKVTDGDKNAKITYIGTNDNVAHVSSDGTVKIVGGGSMHIYAMAPETAIYRQAFADITLKVNKVVPKLKVSSKTVSVAKKTFQLSVSKTGTGKLKFSSSKPSVAAISKTGKVTVKKPGAAKITVRLTENGKYSGVTKNIHIYVNPSKATIRKIKSGKKQLQISWKKKSGVTGYQIRYSLKKNMKQAKTVTVKGASKTEKTIKNLKKKKTYYVQVRAYKKGSTRTYRGNWSEVQKKRTK